MNACPVVHVGGSAVRLDCMLATQGCPDPSGTSRYCTVPVGPRTATQYLLPATRAVSGMVADAGFADVEALRLAGACSTTLSYSLQLYFDFSGYSDMALGLARMFGVRFPLNFNSP